MKYNIPFEKDAREICCELVKQGRVFRCEKTENGWEFEVEFEDDESSGSPMVLKETVMGVEYTIPVSMDAKWKQKNPVDQLTAIRDSIQGDLDNFEDGTIHQFIFVSRLWSKLMEIAVLEPYLKNPKRWKPNEQELHRTPARGSQEV